MSTSRQARLALALSRLGYTEQHGKSRKYRVFAAYARLYYIGKSGALRVGPNIADSISLTDTRQYAALLEIGTPSWKLDTPTLAHQALDALTKSPSSPGGQQRQTAEIDV